MPEIEIYVVATERKKNGSVTVFTSPLEFAGPFRVSVEYLCDEFSLVTVIRDP